MGQGQTEQVREEDGDDDEWGSWVEDVVRDALQHTAMDAFGVIDFGVIELGGCG